MLNNQQQHKSYRKIFVSQVKTAISHQYNLYNNTYHLLHFLTLFDIREELKKKVFTGNVGDDLKTFAKKCLKKVKFLILFVRECVSQFLKF